jgi:hypothetical protein
VTSNGVLKVENVVFKLEDAHLKLQNALLCSVTAARPASSAVPGRNHARHASGFRPRGRGRPTAADATLRFSRCS